MLRKAVLIMSGGLDSSTLLWYLIKKRGYSEIEVLSFYYGQRHSKELEYAKSMVGYVKEKLGVEVNHTVVDISTIHELISAGALTGNEKVPEAFYTEETQKQTIVPNRNMILLSIAAGYAIKVGADKVFYAAHASDYHIYPDCRKEFVKVFDAAVYLGNIWNPVEVEAPFVEMTKGEVVKLGLELGVPYELTWSCYNGRERPCMKCGTCLERTEAFLVNGVKDPLLSDSEWEEAVRIYNEMKKLQEVVV